MSDNRRLIRNWWEWLPEGHSEIQSPSINVDCGDVDTGLVDKRGNKIVRRPEPMGFPIVGKLHVR
jgi:hypothetical protein